MNFLDYNFHTHTYLCRHANGTPEEYIQRAINCGIKDLGFSDHAPMRFPGSEKITTRMKPSDAPGYVAHLRELR
ncbi:MAG: PHP domain-containing protein, partial [Lachnospiraceae bacterium]|nr:PHP domain-containing protein [Lachnospiraceae bacterium]